MHSSIERRIWKIECVCVYVCGGEVNSARKKLMNEEKGEEDGLKKCRCYNNYSSASKLTLKKEKKTAQKQILKHWINKTEFLVPPVRSTAIAQLWRWLCGEQSGRFPHPLRHPPLSGCLCS